MSGPGLLDVVAGNEDEREARAFPEDLVEKVAQVCAPHVHESFFVEEDSNVSFVQRTGDLADVVAVLSRERQGDVEIEIFVLSRGSVHLVD